MNKLLMEVSDKPKFSNDVVIWTRLDADDGLNRAYFDYIQNEATRYFLPQLYHRRILQSILDETPETLIALASGITRDMLAKRLKEKKCNGDDANGVESSTTTTTTTTTPEDHNNEEYILYQHKPMDLCIPVIHINMCVTPGITIAVRGSFNPLEIPRLDHDKIISSLRPYAGRLCGRHGRSVFDTDEGGLRSYQVDDGSCFHMVTVGIAAIRSRTPISAGMLGVQPDATQRLYVTKSPNIVNAMWNSMKKEFGISNRQLISTNTYFTEHVFDIAKDYCSCCCCCCCTFSFSIIHLVAFHTWPSRSNVS
jgi:hypothetical protein